MLRSLAPAAFGLLAGLAFLVGPTPAKAQYYSQPNVGLSFATPNFSLGIGQSQFYQPYPVVVPAPVYAPAPVYYAPRPYAPYYGNYNHSYYQNYNRNYNYNYNQNRNYNNGYGPRGYYR